jgi:hypothetical protein
LLVVEGPAGPLSAQKLAQLRDYITVWAAPSGWKLAAKGQQATYTIRMPLTAKGQKDKTYIRAVIWSDYATSEMGEGVDEESEDPYAFLSECSNYPFGYWGEAFFDVYDFAPNYCYPPTPRHWHGKGPICSPNAERPSDMYLVSTSVARVPPTRVRLPVPSVRVMAMARASFRSAVSMRGGGSGPRSSFRSSGGTGSASSSGSAHSSGGGGFSGGGGGAAVSSGASASTSTASVSSPSAR